MPNKCCVPACKSGYSSISKEDQANISFYKFPTDSIRRDIWLRKIPREKFCVTSYTRVCSLHFSSDMFVSLSTDSKKRRKTSDGEIAILQRPRLKDDACPTIFPNLPSYLSTPMSRLDTSHAETRRIKCNEQIQAKYESMHKNNIWSDNKVMSFSL